MQFTLDLWHVYRCRVQPQGAPHWDLRPIESTLKSKRVARRMRCQCRFEFEFELKRRTETDVFSPNQDLLALVREQAQDHRWGGHAQVGMPAQGS